MFIQYTFAIENQLNHVNYMLHSYTYLLIAPEILVIYFYWKHAIFKIVCKLVSSLFAFSLLFLVLFSPIQSIWS